MWLQVKMFQWLKHTEVLPTKLLSVDQSEHLNALRIWCVNVLILTAIMVIRSTQGMISTHDSNEWCHVCQTSLVPAVVDSDFQQSYLPKPSTGGSWPIFAKFSDRENICPGGRGKGAWGRGRDVNSAQRQVTFWRWLFVTPMNLRPCAPSQMVFLIFILIHNDALLENIK